MLGGRAADIVLGGGANTGAEADLAYATKLLRDATERQGLGEKLVFIPELGNRSSDIGKTIEDQLQRLLKRAIAIVETDRVLALRLAEHLLAERVLAGADVANVLGDGNGEMSPEWSLTLAKGRVLLGGR